MKLERKYAVSTVYRAIDACSYGRSEKGKQARKTVAAVRSKNFSTCAAMNKKGIILFETIGKAFNSEIYTNFISAIIEQLRFLNLKNQIIIMDNNQL